MNHSILREFAERMIAVHESNGDIGNVVAYNPMCGHDLAREYLRLTAMYGKYVLVHLGKSFFQGQNTYLGAAIVGENITDAALLTLDEAENKWQCMNEKEDWEIWSLAPGSVLGEESRRHIIREQRKKLEADLTSLDAKELADSLSCRPVDKGFEF